MKMRKELLCVVFMLALLAAVIPAMPVKAAPDPGLVGLWHFDTVDTMVSPYTTPDSSGLDNHGYLYPVGSEPILVDGKFNEALSFDGTNYVQVDHSTSMDVSGSYTFEAWVYLDDDMDYRGIFRRGTMGTEASEIEIYIWPGPSASPPRDRRLVVIHNRGGAVGWKYFTPFPLDQWVHLAVTWDGTTLKAYYDSIEQNPVGGTLMVNNPATSGKPSFIGQGYFMAWMFGGTPFMVGLIDEVRLWDQALTPVQVAASYNLRLGTEIGQEDLNGDGYPDIIFTSAFYLGRQATGWSTSITMTILPVNPSVTIGYDIDGADGVEPDEYVVIVRVTPKGTAASVSTGTLSPSSYSVTVTATQGSPPCNSMHLWLYLSTGAHVGVNVQFLPYD